MFDRALDEDGMLTAIIDAALWSGWLIHHARRSDRAKIQGTSGLPDLIGVSPGGRVIAWELKGPRGRPTRDQEHWLRRLELAGCIDVRIVGPDDLDAALAVIRATP
jgi:hypothetical protein